MEIRYFKEYSQCLNRDMEFNVYGTGGTPMLVFPSQDGRFYDFANNAHSSGSGSGSGSGTGVMSGNAPNAMRSIRSPSEVRIM